MTPAVAASSFGGKGGSIPNFAQGLEVWRRATNLDAAKGNLALVLQMGPAAREGCAAVGIDQLSESNAAQEPLKVSA